MAPDYSALLILYADSDADSLLAFRDALADSFAVTTAASGEEALQLLRERTVAVIVSERQLSDMTGITLLERSRALRPAAARLLITGELDASTAIDAINLAQVSGYLAKPWQADALRTWLRNTLEALHDESAVQSMEMRLWHGGQAAAATTIYEELVHELSNPLGALEINASLVADQLRSLAFESHTPESLPLAIEPAREAQADAMAAIDQIKGLVSRMRHGRPLDRARLPGPSRCDVASVIHATVRVVRAEVERVAELAVDLEGTPTAVQMDASALGQVVLNLLLNAAQALRPEQRAHNRVYVRAQERAGQLELAITDNGVGIPEEHRERVFEPFFTTKETGTGLGLAICRELLSQCYGTIRVRPQPGGGTRVQVLIPIAKAG